MQRYDERIGKIRIGESLLSFKTKDVVLILALPCDGDMGDFKKNKTQSDFKENTSPKPMKETWILLKQHFSKLF